MKDFINQDNYGFDDLLTLMAILRGENGCPWDKEQTHESIKMNTIEEAYEVLEAINQGDDENLKEELGDLLLHVVFHGRIAEEAGKYDISAVIDGLVKKLIRRHPHVFGEAQDKDSETVLKSWERIKDEEKNHPSLSNQMGHIPRALPALMRAYKVQKKAAKVGFDFESVADAFAKIEEETKELEAEMDKQDLDRLSHEIGDLLFSAVNVSRFYGINPEIALTNATEKFINRFRGMEAMAKKKGLTLENMSLEAMDQLWNKYKSDQEL